MDTHTFQYKNTEGSDNQKIQEWLTLGMKNKTGSGRNIHTVHI